MKHNWSITLVLVSLFLITQLFGLLTLGKNMGVRVDDKGVISIDHEETIVGKPPKTSSGIESIAILTLAIVIGTIILLFFMKLGIRLLFKYWYLFAVFTTMAVTLGVYVVWFKPYLNTFIAIILAALLAYVKVFRQNVVIHNATEVLVYTGIVVLFVSLFEGWLWAAFVLLIIISLYDMFAVWHSKHMIAMATYQQESKVFAGLSIPYAPSKKTAPLKSETTVKSRVAMLGGGDLAFPLLFCGSVMSHLILLGYGKMPAFFLTSIIALCTTLALLGLFIYGKKDRFYPAMPFLSVGCFVGYGIITLII